MIENAEAGCLVSAQRTWLGLEGFIPASFVLMTLVAATLAVTLDITWLLAIPPIVWFLGVPIWDWLSRDASAPDYDSTKFSEQHRLAKIEPGTAGAGLATVGIILLVVTKTHSVGALIGLSISGGLLLVLACNSFVMETEAQMTKMTLFTRIGNWLFKGLLLIPIFGASARYRHHKLASTQNDETSARMGEGYFAYLRRFVAGVVQQAWRSYKDVHGNATTNQDERYSGLDTELGQLAGLAVLYLGLASIVGGTNVVVFLLVQALVAFWQITARDYTEHYGLLRKQLANGKHELLTDKHVWQLAGNLNNSLLNGRDHHYIKNLHRHADPAQNLPLLPIGCNLASIVVMFPAIWFRLINGRLAEIVKFNLHDVNLDGSAYVGLMEKYHRPESTKA